MPPLPRPEFCRGQEWSATLPGPGRDFALFLSLQVDFALAASPWRRPRTDDTLLHTELRRCSWGLTFRAALPWSRGRRAVQGAPWPWNWHALARSSMPRDGPVKRRVLRIWTDPKRSRRPGT